MAEFTRIQVHPAEEEDIVIQAGVVQDALPREEADAASVASPESEPAQEALPQAAPSARDDYRETTLEDLQHAGMSSMQKAIIALAIVGVAVFIIWYVFLR